MSGYVILHTQGGLSVTNHASLNRSVVRLGFLKEIHLFTDEGYLLKLYMSFRDSFHHV